MKAWDLSTSELSTYMINLSGRVRYVPWYDQTSACAGSMSQIELMFDDQVKLGIM